MVKSVKNSLVSVTRCTDIHDFRSVYEAVSRSVGLAGGLESIVVRGDLILIKPNVLIGYDYKTGAVTNPNVVRSLVRMAKDAGAKKVVIAESSMVGCKTIDAFSKSGYNDLAREEGVELIDLKKTDTVYIGIPNGVIFRRLEIPKIILEADIIVNVPVMKTHDMLSVTLGLKNMKGIIKDQDKKRFHILGIGQSVVDINKLVLPQLTVIDGTVGMEGVGPLEGDPVNLGLILASFDTVAADTVAASIMGFNPKEIDYINLAAEQGLGQNDMSKIEISGETIETVKHPFRYMKMDFNELEKRLGIKIIESGACSGCRHSIESLFLHYMKNDLDKLKNCTLIFGQNVKPPAEIRNKLICFGTCTKKFKAKGDYIPGCPPPQDNFMQYLGLDFTF